jgi:hypothetical protein
VLGLGLGLGVACSQLKVLCSACTLFETTMEPAVHHQSCVAVCDRWSMHVCTSITLLIPRARCGAVLTGTGKKKYPVWCGDACGFFVWGGMDYGQIKGGVEHAVKDWSGNMCRGR